MPSFYMALQASSRQEEETLRRGPWLEEEDEQLIAFVNVLGDRRWDYIAQVSGLRRSGKSCRLRWKNYLRPNLKHGNISEEEQQIILQLQAQWGNKWSKIARFLPGRTDNEIKNYWKTRMRKKSQHDQAHQESHLTNINQDFTVQHKDEEDSNPDRQCSPGDDSLTSAGSSLNTFGDPSEFQSVISSPYEARFLDWACESSWNPMSGVETKEYELQGTNFEQYPSWKLEEEQEEEETNTWDCPISLWK